MGGSEVKLGGVGLIRGELTDGSEDGKARIQPPRWIQFFSAGETGGDTVVEGEGVSVWEVGGVMYMAGEEADPTTS